MKPTFILKAKSSLIKIKLKTYQKKYPAPQKKFWTKNQKIVVHMVNLELEYPTPQLDQILKPIMILVNTILYRQIYRYIYIYYIYYTCTISSISMKKKKEEK